MLLEEPRLNLGETSKDDATRVVATRPQDVTNVLRHRAARLSCGHLWH